MVNLKKHLTNSPVQTKGIGRGLAQKVLRKKLSKKAQVLALKGDLGSGKTTFLQGFARGLGVREKILSPTFVILKKFRVKNSKFKFFYHIDCYRILKPKEISDLGFKEIISDPGNIVAVEWAERVKKILPKNSLVLKFEFIDKSKRKIEVKCNND